MHNATRHTPSRLHQLPLRCQHPPAGQYDHAVQIRREGAAHRFRSLVNSDLVYCLIATVFSLAMWTASRTLEALH